MFFLKPRDNALRNIWVKKNTKRTMFIDCSAYTCISKNNNIYKLILNVGKNLIDIISDVYQMISALLMFPHFP